MINDAADTILYSNQWAQMFGSKNVDIASDLPLWAVQDDDVPGVNTVTALMGGWQKAYAKQYNLGKRTRVLSE